MAMLEDVPDLTLAMLNEATQAWVEYEYNRKIHSEIGEAPDHPLPRRPGRDAAEPGQHDTQAGFHQDRTADPAQERRHDRHRGPPLRGAKPISPPDRVEIRFASWDLALVHLVDEQTGAVLCRLFPQDKNRNANGLRRSLEPITDEPIAVQPAGGMAPLLASLMEQRAATGLPPAYLPKDEGEEP